MSRIAIALLVVAGSTMGLSGCTAKITGHIALERTAVGDVIAQVVVCEGVVDGLVVHDYDDDHGDEARLVLRHSEDSEARDLLLTGESDDASADSVLLDVGRLVDGTTYTVSGYADQVSDASLDGPDFTRTDLQALPPESLLFVGDDGSTQVDDIPAGRWAERQCED